MSKSSEFDMPSICSLPHSEGKPLPEVGTILHLAVSADSSIFFDGLSVGNATSIIDQPCLPRIEANINHDNYVGVGAWMKIGINNTDINDQGAFDAANNRLVVSSTPQDRE